MTLNIIYPNGRMNINIGNFLDVCGVTKFRKLLKVIQMSYTPEEHVNKLREYMVEYLKTVDERLEKTTKKADIRLIERNIKNFNKYLELLKDV